MFRPDLSAVRFFPLAVMSFAVAARVVIARWKGIDKFLQPFGEGIPFAGTMQCAELPRQPPVEKTVAVR